MPNGGWWKDRGLQFTGSRPCSGMLLASAVFFFVYAAIDIGGWPWGDARPEPYSSGPGGGGGGAAGSVARRRRWVKRARFDGVGGWFIKVIAVYFWYNDTHYFEREGEKNSPPQKISCTIQPWLLPSWSKGVVNFEGPPRIRMLAFTIHMKHTSRC